VVARFLGPFTNISSGILSRMIEAAIPSPTAMSRKTPATHGSAGETPETIVMAATRLRRRYQGSAVSGTSNVTLRVTSYTFPCMRISDAPCTMWITVPEDPIRLRK
jgi:hypothetical protein